MTDRTGLRSVPRAIYRFLALALLLPLPTLLAAPHVQASTAQRHQAAFTFSTVLLHVEGSGGAFSANNASLAQVRAGQRVRLVMYVRVAGLTGPTAARVALTLRRGGTTLFTSSSTFNVTPATLGGHSAGWIWFWDDLAPCSTPLQNRVCLPAVPGQYTFTGSIRMGGLQGSRTIGFTET